MKLRYNYRLYPNKTQRELLSQAFGCARVVWNDALRVREDAFRNGESYITDNELGKRIITKAKKTEERKWLRGVPNVVLQQSLNDLNKAYKGFFAGVRGARKDKPFRPKYKKKVSKQSIRFTRGGFSFRNKKLYLAKIGELKVVWSRQLPSNPSSVTIVRTATEKYYASFVVDVDPEALPEVEEKLGIDLGLSHYAVDSKGRKIQSPKFFRQAERKLRRANKDLSRKKKGSNNYKKAKLRLAKVHEKIKHQRADFIHKTTTQLIHENQVIVVEDLNVKGMMSRKGKKGKSLSDQSLGMFVTTLESKCLRYGRTFKKVGRFFPSTQLCSTCSFIEGPKGLQGLSIRQWTCSCGTVHDRDVNASLNILAAGTVACGEDVRPPLGRQTSVKQ